MKIVNELAGHLAERARDLLAQHISEAEEAALEADEAKAKVSLKIEWEVNSTNPKTKVLFNRTTQHKDEIEDRFDPNQSKLWGHMDGVDKVTMRMGDGPENTLYSKHPFQLASSQLHDAASREAVIESAKDAAKLEQILNEDCGPPLQKNLRKKAEARLKRLRAESAA